MTTINDLFSKASNGTAPVVSALLAQKAISAGSLSLTLATGWPTTTPVHFLLYKIDTSNALVPGSVTLWKGILSGTTVSNLTLKSGSDDVYPAGSVVELAFTSAQLDDLIAGLLVSHNQDGTLVTNIPLNAPVVTSPTYKGAIDGWVGANESWTFASSTTITVPTDATTKYAPGDWVKITQSATVKHFVITSVTSTVLTVSGVLPTGTTVANSAITANAYSKTRNPGVTLNGVVPYNPYKFRVYRNAALNSVSATLTALPFDTKNYDTGSNVDVVTNKGRFTAPISGFYFFNGAFGSNTNIINATLFKNGSQVTNGMGYTVSSVNLSATVSDCLQLAANDYVELYYYINGVNAIVANSYTTYFSGFLISAT